MLSRWFPAEVVGPPPQAKFLDLILYSREQIRKENEAMGEDSESVGVAAGNFSIPLSLPPSIPISAPTTLPFRATVYLFHHLPCLWRRVGRSLGNRLNQSTGHRLRAADAADNGHAQRTRRGSRGQWCVAEPEGLSGKCVVLVC